MANAAIDIWPDEAIEAMHLAALALLERAGVKVESRAPPGVLLGARGPGAARGALPGGRLHGLRR
jgi:hypothetical protein